MRRSPRRCDTTWRFHVANPIVKKCCLLDTVKLIRSLYSCDDEAAVEASCRSHAARSIWSKQRNYQVIIETPKGSRNKYAYDTRQKIFTLRKVLPAGMAFPYDFGFLPKTLAADGDAIDVLLLMDEPAFCGCAVQCRIIGVIEGEQIDGKKRIRNNRLVAIAEANHEYAYIKKMKDLPSKTLKECRTFL
jgi:inorganic pyrophosphatase